MSDVEIVDGAFYWVWIEVPNAYRGGASHAPALVVASPWRHRLEWQWEGVGTDEGVRVLSVVAKIEPPKSTPPTDKDHLTTYSSITCARPCCGATLAAECVNGTDVIPIVAEREGWIALESGWYCPCCRSPECPHDG